MNESFYKIVGQRGIGCKIYFSDKRLDNFRKEIYDVFSPIEMVHGSSLVDDVMSENILRKKEDCLHKVIGVRYCLLLIENEIANKLSKKEIKNYSEMIANKMCNQAELKNEVLIYETEAFLFQVKSSLDILVQLLKYVPGYEYLDSKRDFDSESFIFDKKNKKEKENTVNKMIENKDTAIGNFFVQQTDEWIRELNDMRNIIAHRSGLVGFTSFVFDSGSEQIIDPQILSGKKVEEYCSNIFKKLLALHKRIVTDFILPKL